MSAVIAHCLSLSVIALIISHNGLAMLYNCSASDCHVFWTTMEWWPNGVWKKEPSTLQLKRCTLFTELKEWFSLRTASYLLCSRKEELLGKKHSVLLNEYLLKGFLCTQQWWPYWIMFFFLLIWYLRVINNENPVLHHVRNEPCKIVKIWETMVCSNLCKIQKVRGTIRSRHVVLKHKLDLL